MTRPVVEGLAQEGAGGRASTLAAPHSPSVPAGEELLRAAAAAGVAEAGRLRGLVADVEQALSERAGDLAVAGAVEELARSAVPRWHFAMLNDVERNDALSVALERGIRPGARVLDIGSGTGLLAMMAVRAGAASVTTCEENPLLAEITRQVVAANGLSAQIEVIGKRSTGLRVGRDVAAPFDLIVAEVVDCGLIGEGILPTVAHARRHLLADGGRLIPTSARLMACLLDSEVCARLNRVQAASGFDLRLFNRVATAGHFPLRLGTWPHRLLSAPLELARFDFRVDPLADGVRTVAAPVTGDGTAHGLVAWFEMDLGAGVVLRNSPDNLCTHWMQAYVPYPEPVRVSAGDTALVEVSWMDGRITARTTT